MCTSVVKALGLGPIQVFFEKRGRRSGGQGFTSKKKKPPKLCHSNVGPGGGSPHKTTGGGLRPLTPPPHQRSAIHISHERGPGGLCDAISGLIFRPETISLVCTCTPYIPTSQLCAQRQGDLDKQARKRSSSAPQPKGNTPLLDCVTHVPIRASKDKVAETMPAHVSIRHYPISTRQRQTTIARQRPGIMGNYGQLWGPPSDPPPPPPGQKPNGPQWNGSQGTGRGRQVLWRPLPPPVPGTNPRLLWGRWGTES